MQALILFWKINSEYRSKEIKHYVNKAVIFIENNQKKDGSWFVLLHHLFCINYCHFLLLITKLAIFSTWYGTWGICFVYGTLYAIKGGEIMRTAFASGKHVDFCSQHNTTQGSSHMPLGIDSVVGAGIYRTE